MVISLVFLLLWFSFYGLCYLYIYIFFYAFMFYVSIPAMYICWLNLFMLLFYSLFYSSYNCLSPCLRSFDLTRIMRRPFLPRCSYYFLMFKISHFSYFGFLIQYLHFLNICCVIKRQGKCSCYNNERMHLDGIL